MSGVTIHVTDTELRRRLESVAASVTNASGLMLEWGELAEASIKLNFQAGGRPTHWRPLAPATIKARIGRRKTLRRMSRAALSKRNRNPFRITFLRPLVVTGELSRVRYRVRPLSVTIGTSPAARQYAAIQNFGGRAGRGRRVTIPARPFMLLQEADKAEMAARARAFLIERSK